MDEAIETVEEPDEAADVAMALADLQAIPGPTATAPTQAPSASTKTRAASTPPPAPTCKEAALYAAIGCDGVGR